jgi:hypothetical protein
MDRAAIFRPLQLLKKSRFARGLLTWCKLTQCANVFTGVFVWQRHFERLPDLPEPHYLSQ